MGLMKKRPNKATRELMSHFKVPVIRSEKHKVFVRSHDCLIERNSERCNGTPLVSHHFTFIKYESSTGRKAPDIYTVPLCDLHHKSLHHVGEKEFWKSWGFTLPQLIDIARELCERSPCDKVKNCEELFKLTMERLLWLKRNQG